MLARLVRRAASFILKPKPTNALSHISGLPLLNILFVPILLFNDLFIPLIFGFHMPNANIRLNFYNVATENLN